MRIEKSETFIITKIEECREEDPDWSLIAMPIRIEITRTEESFESSATYVKEGETIHRRKEKKNEDSRKQVTHRHA